MAAPLKPIEPGTRFGRLVCLHHDYTGRSGALWRCICDCGRRVNVLGSSLRSKRTRSCSCWQVERFTAIRRGLPVPPLVAA